jgi:YD repeat-containing protein
MLDIIRRLAVISALAAPLQAIAGYPPGAKVHSWTYNARGQKLTETAPDGTTTWTYFEDKTADHMVGDLQSETASDGRVTRYTYDAAGQLKRLTLPDGSWVGWDYDDAHRKVAVYDEQGNRIDYLLDMASIKVRERVLDPRGSLRRTLERIADDLGRVQKTEGQETAP